MQFILTQGKLSMFTIYISKKLENENFIKLLRIIISDFISNSSNYICSFNTLIKY